MIIVEQGRSDGGGYRYLYPPKSAQVNLLWGKMTSERLFNSFIHPQKLLYPPPKKISGYAPVVEYSCNSGRGCCGLSSVICRKWLHAELRCTSCIQSTLHYAVHTGIQLLLRHAVGGDGTVATLFRQTLFRQSGS